SVIVQQDSRLSRRPHFPISFRSKEVTMSPSYPVRPPNPGGADLLRWICTKNPFYAISAALVLLGLWVSFGNQAEEAETWFLMGGLAGYTLLLAGTAFMLVRYLACWDDARTV